MSDQLKLQSAAVNMAELDKLAKLLATENITITHKGTQTAYFDTNRRELVLPVWDNLSKELYHMLVLHEVGHALYTDPVQWEAEIRADPKIKPAANVIEDARIERMMKEKYPGSRRDFRTGYENLLNRDFFKLGNRSIANLSLGDRINLYYKIGELVSIPFSKKERIFITAIDRAKTFADVLRIARELRDYMGKNKQVSQEFAHEFEIQDSSDEDDDWDDEGADDWDDEGADDWDDEDDDGSDAADGGDADEDYDEDEEENYGDDGDASGVDAGDNDNEITTTEALEEALKAMAAGNAGRAPLYYEVFDDYDSTKWIVSYKTILEMLRTHYPESVVGDNYRKMRKNNIKIVDYLAKEFYIRKAADGYSRTKESKTGIINPDKIHAYRMIDDIFRRNTVVAESKNHGLVMFIDFSGSMQHHMKRTIEQLVNLVLFCRKVNIPHRVYAFTNHNDSFVSSLVPSGNLNRKLHADHIKYSDIIQQRQEYILKKLNNLSGEKFLVPEREMNLLELFNSSMSTRDLHDMMEGLLYSFDKPGLSYEPQFPVFFNLGGTPLDSAVLLSSDIAQKFKKQTGTQIVSTVFLTDGDSSGAQIVSSNRISRLTYDDSGNHVPVTEHRMTFGTITPYQNYTSAIRHHQTKKVFRLGPSPNAEYSLTTGLLLWIKTLGFTTIGYRVEGSYQTHNILRHKIPDGHVLTKIAKANKCLSVPNVFGFDLWTVIVSDGPRYIRTTNTTIEDVEEGEDFSFEIKEGASKGQIAKAFISARKDRLNMRSVLQAFIKKIAA